MESKNHHIIIGLQDFRLMIKDDIKWAGHVRSQLSPLLYEEFKSILVKLNTAFKEAHDVDEAIFKRWLSSNKDEVLAFIKMRTQFHENDKIPALVDYINCLKAIESVRGLKYLQHIPQWGKATGKKEDFIYFDHEIYRDYYIPQHLLAKKSVSADNESIEKYKIHLGIDIDSYVTYLPLVMPALENAVANGTIETFKIINVEKFSIDQMKDDLSVLDTKSEIFKNINRSYNNPITIYLPLDADLQKITALCIELEKILSLSPHTDKSLSQADVPLSNHISIRPETLNGKKVTINQDNLFLINQLQKNAMESVTYQLLKKNIDEKLFDHDFLYEQLSRLKTEANNIIYDSTPLFLLYKGAPSGVVRLREAISKLDTAMETSQLLAILKDCFSICDEKKLFSSTDPHKLLYNKWYEITKNLLENKNIDQYSKITPF